MKQKLALSGLLAATIVMTLFPAFAAQKTLRGHIPSIAASLTANGSVAATRELRLAIGVPLREFCGISGI